MKANFSAATAKRYLDTKAEEFGAQRRDDKELGTVYYHCHAVAYLTIVSHLAYLMSKII